MVKNSNAVVVDNNVDRRKMLTKASHQGSLINVVEKVYKCMITACTVVQAVVKANSQSNGNGQISTRRGSETPERGWSQRTRDLSHVSVS